MNHFSQVATLEKNRLASDAPFIMLVKVTCRDLPEPIYLARNTEDVIWNGVTWTAFPIDIGSCQEDGKTLPSVDLKISSGQGLIVTYLQQYNGLVDSEVSMYCVSSKLLSVNTPEMEMDYVIMECSYDEQWITFTCSASPEMADRHPKDRYLTDYCPFVCGDIRCGYAGKKTCKNNLASCLIPERFGGEPGIQTAG